MEQIISINSYIENLDSHSIFSAKELHQTLFKEKTFGSFCKALSRLENEKKIERLAKGIYYKPKTSTFGLGRIPISEVQILRHYLGKESMNGLVIGYSLFRRYGLTTQVENRFTVYSNLIDTTVRKIHNVTIYKLDGQINDQIKHALEFLFILDTFQDIQDLNYSALLKYFKNACELLAGQDINSALCIKNFSKKTIAQAKIILEYYGVKNDLNRYLSPISSYNIMNMEDFYPKPEPRIPPSSIGGR